MQGRPTRKNLFAILLLAISLLSLTPALAHANQQNHFVATHSPLQATTIGASVTVTTPNASAPVTSMTNQTQYSNSTITYESLTAVNNTTESNVANANSTYTANSTLATEASNTTATLSANAGAQYIQQSSRNITVTVTQYFGVTTSTTVTVENTTILYTVTNTVANTTVTQANSTITITATTGS